MKFIRNHWYQIMLAAFAGMSWIIAFIALVVILLTTVILPVQLLKKRDSEYFIPEWQNQQFEKKQ